MHRSDALASSSPAGAQRALLALLVLLPFALLPAAAQSGATAQESSQQSASAAIQESAEEAISQAPEQPSGQTSEQSAEDSPGAAEQELQDNAAGTDGADGTDDADSAESPSPKTAQVEAGEYGSVFSAVDSYLQALQEGGASAENEGESDGPPEAQPQDDAEAQAEEREAQRRRAAATALEDRVLLLVRDGDVVARGRYGLYDEHHVLPLGSASRWLTALVILKLADQGSLELDDPLVRFFPSVAEDQTGITVAQLLTDTSGISPSHPCLALPDAALDQCATSILQQPLSAPPGRELRRSAAAYQVLGRIAELAAAAPWGTVVNRTLTAPLELQELRWEEGGNPSIASGARASASDLATVLQALQGDAWLSEEGRQRLLDTTAPRAEAVADPLSSGEPGAGLRWASVPAPAGQRGTTLEGVINGTFGSQLWLDPERSIAGVLATIAAPETAAEVADVARQAFREHLDSALEESAADAR
ncbi:MAG: serine hydrolase domain-containing protein [Acidobacteriota bacterium]